MTILHRENLNKLELKIESKDLSRKQLSKSGHYVPNEEVISLYEKLSEKCEFVTPVLTGF